MPGLRWCRAASSRCRAGGNDPLKNPQTAAQSESKASRISVSACSQLCQTEPWPPRPVPAVDMNLVRKPTGIRVSGRARGGRGPAAEVARRTVLSRRGALVGPGSLQESSRGLGSQADDAKGIVMSDDVVVI